MNSLKVKVCGITRKQDARAASDLGADMIGMIFSRLSPRHINMSQAKEIVATLPPTVDRVGVFVDQPLDEIMRLVNRFKLDFVQLHGNERSSIITALHKEGVKVIKAFTIEKISDYDPVLRSKADLVMVDNCISGMSGGTGRRFDWRLKPARHLNNLMLAGGLKASNVVEGVKIFRPLVVDVNSGVESSPGLKSKEKLIKFFATCNEIRYGK